MSSFNCRLTNIQYNSYICKISFTLSSKTFFGHNISPCFPSILAPPLLVTSVIVIPWAHRAGECNSSRSPRRRLGFYVPVHLPLLYTFYYDSSYLHALCPRVEHKHSYQSGLNHNFKSLLTTSWLLLISTIKDSCNQMHFNGSRVIMFVIDLCW